MEPKSRIGIGKLLTVGFAIAIGIAIVLGLFSTYSLNKVASDMESVAEGSVNVNSQLSTLKTAAGNAATEASRLKTDMNNKLVKGLRTNSADMVVLQKTFDGLSQTLNDLIESGEEDGTLLMLEIEDIHEMVQREWIPLVRRIVSQINETSAEGTEMAGTVNSLQNNLLGFVTLAEKGAAVTGDIKNISTGSSKSASRTKNIMFGVMILSILGIIVVGFFTKKGIIKPINDVTERIRDIAEGEGDLTKRLDASTKDELGELATGFNTFVAKLQGIIGGLAVNSNVLSETSKQLSISSKQIADGSEEQNIRATQVATATQEMSSTITEIVKNVSSAASEAQDASQFAKNGGKVVSDTINSMNSIAETARESSEIISMLGASSNEIGKIVSVINDIADQTNLLALNAAIEAARAGEQGRGFAVVADEVRGLAERTQTATKEIGAMISDMQNKTTKAITSMETEVKAVEEGVTLATEAGQALSEIVRKVDSVTDMINQISTASEEQSITTEQITRDIEDVASVVSKTSDSAHQIASLGHEIDELASSLKTTVDAFKISEEAQAPVESSVPTTQAPVREIDEGASVLLLPLPGEEQAEEEDAFEAYVRSQNE